VKEKDYDIVIIGGGPAGLSAGIYTARARLKSLLIERGMVGGQIVNAERVDNYPGFPQGISGIDLTQQMHEQAVNNGLETLTADVTGLELNGERKIVKTASGEHFCRGLIIACGSERNKLGIPGEANFTGRGVSYCATCDAAFFRDSPVAVVGGGNAAISEALHLIKFASKVTVIHRRNRLRATGIMQEVAFAMPDRIDFMWDTVVDEVEGDDFVKSLKMRNVKTGEELHLDVAGVFLAIGFTPNTAFLKGVVPLDANGAIIVDEGLETAVKNVYAAGDVRSGATLQVITAVGDGARAAINLEKALGGEI
jgi:thioredoxin reductase (NADPH)